MSLRVALDVTPELFAATGVARYSRELSRALDARDDCEVHRFAIGRRSEEAPRGVRHLPVPLRVVHPLWRMLAVPRAEQLSGRVEIVHSIDMLAPPTRLPLVMTVHDLAAVERPELHPPRTVAIQRRRLAQLGRAAAVIAVSTTTADALARWGVESERIHVTQLGLAPLPEPAQPPVPEGPFVLVVGTLEPRKEHGLLLEAFAAADLDGVRLVFAGPEAGRKERLAAAAARLGIGDRLLILGAVPDRVLAGLYHRAALLCMPSRDEGFGLPVLEAMSAALPVVASDIPAVREVGGDAVVRVPPGDVRAFAEALSRVFRDPARRGELGRLGVTRAAAFTWEATAAATVRVYEAALGT
jgi:glycosyltransferase involved in cell wall biosynthesis